MTYITTLATLSLPSQVMASGSGQSLDLTPYGAGYASPGFFILAYAFVMMEAFTHLRKSKPVMLVAGLIWAMIAVVYANNGMSPVS